MLSKPNISKLFVFSAKPDVTLTIKDSDLVDLMSGKLNSQKAFFQGKLKVTSIILATIYMLRNREAVKKKKMEISIPGGSTPFHLFFSFFVYVLNHPEMQSQGA